MHPFLHSNYAGLQGADTVVVQAAVPGHRVILHSLVAVLRDGFVYVEGIDAAGVVIGIRGAITEGFSVLQTVAAEGSPFVVGEPGEGMRLRSESGDDVQVTFTFCVGPA